MDNEPQSRPGVLARLRGWRKQRRRAAKERRARVEQQISEERYNYGGPGAPGGGG